MRFKDDLQRIKKEKTIKEMLESFIEDDSIPVTAAKFLIAVLALGPLLFVGAAAPGIISLLSHVNSSREYSKKQITNAFYNLKKKKYIEIIQEGNEKMKVKINERGKKKIKELCFEIIEIQKPEIWDKKWRILAFDIPTKPKIYNQARNALRQKVKDLGFYQLQKSLWVYPYECEDEILFIAEAYQVQKYVEILKVERLLNDEKLKKVFKLR